MAALQSVTLEEIRQLLMLVEIRLYDACLVVWACRPLRQSDELVPTCASCPRSVVTIGVVAVGVGGGGVWAAAAGPGGGLGGVFPSWLVLDEPVVWDGFQRAAAHAAAEEVGLKHGFSRVG